MAKCTKYHSLIGECVGHMCIACGELMFCKEHPKHKCKRVHTNMPTGIVRTPSRYERLHDGMALIHANEENDE